MKAALIMFGMLALIAIGSLVFATALGYIPSLSSLTGLGQPRDLGVSYSEVDYLSAQEKLIQPDEAQVIKRTFTDAEVTALFSLCEQYPSCPLADVQVKTHAGGVFEFSGLIYKTKVEDFIRSSDLGPEDSHQMMQVLNYLPTQPAFYAQAQLSGRDDVLSFGLESATVATVSVPVGLRTTINQEVTASLNDYLATLPGTQIETFEVTDKGLAIEGSLSAVLTGGH